VVVFVSDNGGLEGAADMGPLRGAKSTTWEGGIRVPLIIRWPGKIKPNSESEQVSATFDLTRSFLQLAQAAVPPARLDGMDIIRHVAEGREDVARTLFWRGKRGDRTWSAVRAGDLKLVRKQQGDQSEQWLFDLARDPGEQQDLLEDRPADRRRLEQQLWQWEADVRPVR
jgi:arylsulfatase A-like enzyme